MPTAYFNPPECRRHDMGEGHPECPDRLAAIAQLERTRHGLADHRRHRIRAEQSRLVAAAANGLARRLGEDDVVIVGDLNEVAGQTSMR